MIPSLSFAIRQAMDRLAWQHGVYNTEFIQRMQLTFGHPDYFTVSSYGIVDDEDPIAAVAGGSRPLAVSSNVENALNVDVNPGMGVTLSGMWMLLPEAARNLPLATTAENVANVVYLIYRLVDGPVEVNDEKKQVVTFEQRPEDDPDVSLDYAVEVDTVANYFSAQPSVLAERIPLAVVTTVQVQDPNTGVVSSALSIDHTRVSYEWNRPWFSSVDIEHRMKLGTGTQTDQNTHALSLNEVSVGPFGPLELQAPHGLIIGKPQSTNKVPGYACEASVPTSQLITDDSDGTATGFPNATYIELPNYPARVGRVYLQNAGDDFPSLWVPETNRIVFPELSPPVGDSVNIRFTRVEACEPPLKGAVNFITSNPKADEEIIIAGGGGISTLASTEETFGDAYQFPMRYIMFVDVEGNIVKTPQVVFCYQRLDTIATTVTPTIDQYGDAPLMVGLTRAALSVITDVVKIRVYGEDVDGNSIDYLFEFDGATWQDPGPPPNVVLNDAGFKMSVGKIFSKITSIEIDEAVNAGPNAAIMIWACCNPEDTREQMEQAAVIADVMWDGVMMADVRDKRILLSTTADFQLTSDGKMMLEAHVRGLGGNVTTMYVDDLRMPQYGSLYRPPEYDPNENSSYYPWANIDQLYVGRQGTYRTRAFPIFSGSGVTFRVMMLPQGNDKRTAYPAPSIRFFSAGFWGSFIPMAPVPGVPHTYENPAVIGPNQEGLQVQMPYDQFYQNHLWAIYGTGA